MSRQLFHLPLCPFSRKVRLVLGEKRLDFELLQELVWKKRPEFLALNPAGQIPVLLDPIILDAQASPEHRALSHSHAICAYLDAAYPERTFGGQNIEEIPEVLRLVAWADEKLYFEVSGPLIFERVFRRHYDRSPPDSARIRQAILKLEPHLLYLSQLAFDRNWMAGSSLSWADFALAGHLSSLDYFGYINWEKAPSLKEWYGRLKSRPSFRSLLTDRLPAMAPADHYTELDF